ncbi:hypothetical protein J8F10_00280 [Gemmata sp. G18]|uniref:Uncharacterized protein n=1 Tax=Gemmata palustris TaxID=2822762 RepID=A0ABS5BJ60_9BACT|nr:hypothetical protein [Gemmata palustris]MBP3953737.1 hypothetical protein [Gemmata palustris]
MYWLLSLSQSADRANRAIAASIASRSSIVGLVLANAAAAWGFLTRRG